MELYYALVGYIIGVVAALCIVQPIKISDKAYEEGFRAASSVFKDWDRGFRDGWDACERHMAERSEE